ncbi:DUF6320 domain-containing protein [Vallitalea okinawensis]|uniref:DUF6320 domain-containing protein n=1 Tax=Vallitalea okinawensis TaxID=2078660 RepID=UPI000CFE14A0|nr:DUF6320 domain-containing protein [Vallitalea okinawensis]
MPYCPKCGVEVDRKIDNCPLCTFPIPDVGSPKKKNDEERFPITLNIYPQRIKEMRNISYFAISIVCFAAVLICYTVANAFNQSGPWLNYTVIGIIGGWLAIYFLFGFAKGFIRGNLGCALVAIGMCYFLDQVDGTFTWFNQIALPIIFSYIIIAFVLYTIFMKFRHQVEFLTIAIYICAGFGLFALVLQLIISNFIADSLMVDWSIIILIVMISIILLLLGLKFGIPDDFKEKLKRKFHI